MRNNISLAIFEKPGITRTSLTDFSKTVTADNPIGNVDLPLRSLLE
jgi:hypothetical protein